MPKLLILLALLSFKVQAENIISDLRIWQAPDGCQIVLDMSKSVNYQLDYSAVSSQLQVKLANTKSRKVLDRKLKSDKRLGRIRTKTLKNDLLLAFDLKSPIRPKSFLALPNEKYGYRLIIELKDKEPENFPIKSIKGKKFLVALDAGHGGEDSGAIGINNLYEKDVVLTIAQYLKNLIDANPDMRAVLLRNSDYYLSLQNRVRLAEKIKSDIFISIHADAYKDNNAKGASVYVLSKTGASSSMADWLAAKENAADTIGGVAATEEPNSVLELILTDLIAKAKQKGSKHAAQLVLDKFKHSKLMNIHSKRVERANFFVLRNNSIPAILIETGFMSNPDEAELLAKAEYRKQIALLIYKALVEYKQGY